MAVRGKNATTPHAQPSAAQLVGCHPDRAQRPDQLGRVIARSRAGFAGGLVAALVVAQQAQRVFAVVAAYRAELVENGTFARFGGTPIACPYRLKIGASFPFSHVRSPWLFR